MARAAPPDFDATPAPLRALARSYPRGLHIEPHSHDWGQVLYAMSGVMWLETPSEALLVPPNRAVWLPPQVPHGIRVVSELQMRNIYLRPGTADSLGEQVQAFEVGGLLRELIVTLVQHEREPDTDYYQALSQLAVLELQRARSLLLRVPLPEDSDRRLLNLCLTVMAEPSQEISFEQHAADAGASVRTLARLFQRSLGMGFADWRRQVQLATAAAALIDGRPVAGIAHALGYTPSAFSDMFRRELGVSPTEYRAEHHQPFQP